MTPTFKELGVREQSKRNFLKNEIKKNDLIFKALETYCSKARVIEEGKN
jgi:hypothetical protein